MPIGSLYTFGINRNVISPPSLKKGCSVTHQLVSSDLILMERSCLLFMLSLKLLLWKSIRSQFQDFGTETDANPTIGGAMLGPAWDFGLQTGESGMQPPLLVTHFDPDFPQTP